uniref:Trafficking protein particle complex subunit 8 n=1 Tax=Propithecus coquereli TaxID=379532 RepID=A0A2K6GCU5_PROCO
MRDPNNQLHIIKNLKIAVSNIITQPPQPGAIRKLLNDVVSGSQPAEGLVANVITAGDYDLNISATTPWFESYRETFLQSMPASDHEFLNHYLACMLVASSSEAEPVEQFSKLSQEQHRIQHNSDYSYPKWFIPNTLKYYVLLHDVSAGDEQRAESIYEEMKQKYGTQGCYLLKINSRASNRASDEQIPDPWSQYLQKNSIQNQVYVKKRRSKLQKLSINYVFSFRKWQQCQLFFNQEHLGHTQLITWIQQFRHIGISLISRKGLSRSLFSATKKWFSGSKVPEKSINELKNTSGLLYPPEAPELQIRKMADLCFLVQHYDLAYSCYHTAKKDFLNDQAMLYAAGALVVLRYYYSAHYIFVNMVLAERCVLLSAEILKSQSKYSEAAALLIRLTSESLLTKTCHCFKKHALRCYCQAMQVYKGKGWSLAEDHINFTIGRQSYTLRQLDNAVSAFRHILINESKQSAAQQGAFLREYLYVYKVNTYFQGAGVHKRVFNCDNFSLGEKQAATHVSLDQEYDSESSQQWRELEEQVVAVVNKGIIPSNFHPTQYCLNSYSDNSRFPLAVVEEPITVEVAFRNPLKVPLLLTDLSLLWKFQPKDFSGKDNEEVKELVITFSTLKALHSPAGKIVGIDFFFFFISGKYSVSMSVRGKQDLEIQGPRLNNTKEEKTSIKYGPDRRLDPIITEEMPLLEVFFIHFPTGLLCGEIRKAYVEFVNVSKCPLTGLKVVSKRPEFFTFGGNTAVLTPLSPSASENCSAYKTVVTDSTSVCTALTSSASSVDFGIGIGSQPEVIPVPLPDTVLLPGASVQLPMWLRGPDEEGVHEINFLFYYESVKKQPKIRHRILRHTAVICTSRSLNVRATVCRSNSLEDEEGRGGNMLVFVDVENTNTVSWFKIESHKVLSRNAKIASREKGKFCFKAIRCKEKEAATQSSEKYTFADIIFGNEQFYLPSNIRLVAFEVTAKQSNIFAYVVEDSKQLILEGQHHVILRTIGKEAFSYPQKQQMKPHLTHTFSITRKRTLLTTNFLLISSFYHRKVAVETTGIQKDWKRYKRTEEALEIHGSFTWLGQTQYKLQLKSQEIQSLQLKACFVHTGVYNLGTPRVFAKLSDQVTVFETSQQNSMPALIIINNV